MLLTRAEATHYEETSRHADVVRFISALDHPRLHVASFGASPEGRSLPLLVLSNRGIRTPEEARRGSLPVVLIINGIHAGEVEGKEASLMLVRDILAGKSAAVLDDVVLLVVPLFNPDGNDRIDPRNRVLDLEHLEGQIGPPTGVGTRVNASGINLNRDYMRQDALEMRLLQRGVCHPWEPHLTVDCHSTNGSVHRFDLTYDIPHTVESGRREPIAYLREQLLPAVAGAVKRGTGRDTFYYGNFVDDEGGTGEGWTTYPHHPRFGSNYRGLTNRLDLLLETYSYQPFPDRVAVTYAFLEQTLGFVAGHARDVLQVVASSARPPDRVAVRYRLEAFPEPAAILTRRPRTLEGAPIAVTIPHLAHFVGTEVVERPWGYAAPAALAERLEGHGLLLRRLERDTPSYVEAAHVDAAESEGARKILEASSERMLEAHYAPADRTLPAGTVIVPTDQPRGAIAVYLCEAASDDGVVACGMIEEPPPGGEFPIYRLREPVG